MTGMAGNRATTQRESFGIETTGNLQLTAAGAGDLLNATRREVRAVLRRAKGSRVGAMKLGLTRLVEDGSITAKDRTKLRQLVDAVHVAGGSTPANAKAAAKVRRIHDALVADRASSDVAVALASVANSFVTSSAAPGASAALVGMDARAQNTILGGILGAVLGAALGGPAGAVSGAIVGANAGAKTKTGPT